MNATEERTLDPVTDPGTETAPEAAAAGPRYPGVPSAMDGTAAVVAVETAAGEAAGAYPITPATQMGEGWAQAVAEGRTNVFGRRLIFFEPEGEHAAAGVTAGLAMMGLRSANFSAGQGIAYMHESLYAAVGKRLTYVLNMACRAMTKHALNVHAGHDDYHSIDDTGFFQLFAKDAQESADLNLIAHRVAELSLTPGVCAQDGFLTSHVIESLRLPERELVAEYLGDPDDLIESPTPAQRLVFGPRRRRIPELFDLDNPAMLGVVQNQDSYAQGVASQRPFFFDHVAALTDRAMAEYAELTGRLYRRASGYRMDDADYVLVGQGSVVANAEAAADYLREARGLKVGVVNVTMFRPFPSYLLAALLRGRKGVTVLERLDQPLAVDPPLLREIRSALGKAVENARAGRSVHEDLPAVSADDVPDCYSGCFGMGSRDLQPGDLVAAVENMLPPSGDHPGDECRGRRQFYLGVEFVRKGKLPKRLAEWQEQIVAAYPRVAELALEPALDSGEVLSLLPAGSLAVRIHSVGGWGAITMGKNLTMTLFDLLGMQVKSNPKYGSEKKGQPTTFYGVFAHEPIRVNCELKHVDVVLSPDPNVFRHSNPLTGLAPGGTFVIQTPEDAREDAGALWRGLPAWARKIVRERGLRVFHLDGFRIAKDETDHADLQFRMQGAAFQGAFFRTSPVMEREGPAHGLTEASLFEAIRQQLEKKFGHRGESVVEDNYRVIRRGFDEVAELDWRSLDGGADVEEEAAAGQAEIAPPWYLDETLSEKITPFADPTRFMHQVCSTYRDGTDPIADPFAALSAIPAATGVLRDMTGIRFEVPELIAERCTGCGQCWTQCPDAAIPGLVVEVDRVIRSAVEDWTSSTNGRGGPSPVLEKAVNPLAKEVRRLLREEKEYTSFGAVVTRAWERIAPKMELSATERSGLDHEMDAVVERLAEMPLARTAPFFTVPERREEGSGGLLAITVNPNACKGCNLCVEVCPDDALWSAPQTEDLVAKLRRNWQRWESLPDTPDRFLQVTDLDEGIGVLHTLLLKKRNYHSMVGGDGACMGCGEKTGMHLVVATIEAAMAPRVAAFVGKLEDLIARLEDKAEDLLTRSADLDEVAEAGEAHLDLQVPEEDRARLARITRAKKRLEDLRWRYTSGPSGRGRASLGIANATGCSSVWGGTYPYNPYPYPWTNHLFQDAPSVAIGLFEGVMRKMADGFAAVRTAELELADAYDASTHGPLFEAFDWQAFSDEEFRLCPPILAVGGDGAMLDIGFQNVSRLLASGKPLRVVVLDTQVYSNTGGQACTSGFMGQVSDMAAYGDSWHGKQEHRKEMGLIAMAHRGAYVVQTSQALPAHLVGGVLKALGSRRPAVINVYTPCQAEHGLPDSASAHAAKLALESRAFPFLTYDPDAGATVSERLDLEGNPAVEETWPTYELESVDDAGEKRSMTLPLTTADWAATEPRFAKHFRRVRPIDWHDGMVPFAEYLELSAADRQGKTPFLWAKEPEERLGRLAVAEEMVSLAEERIDLWNELRELAGVRVPDRVRARIEAPLEQRLEKELGALKEEYEMKIAQLRERYPAEITRKLAEALVHRQGEPGLTLAGGTTVAATPPPPSPPPTGGAAGPAPAESEAEAASAAAAEAAPAPEAPEPADDSEALEPWIETELCTTCNECTQLNPKIFAYDANKQAYIKDPRGGPYSDIVKAAERCTAKVIHPGTPLDPNEPDLDKWIKRAEPYQ